MSWEGLKEEGKEYIRERRPFLVALSVALIFLLSIALLYTSIRYLQQNEDREVSDDDSQAQELVQQLLELQRETERLQNELKEQESKAAQPETLPAPPPVARSQSPSYSFVGTRPGEGFQRIEVNREEKYIPTGAVFRARLLMPIKTGIQETFVMAETTHEYRMDSVRRIPRNSRLIGTARLNPMLKGVVVRFHTLVSPNGKEYSISLLALSRELFPELEGIYFSDELQTYSSIFAFGFLGGFADAARQRDPSFVGPMPREDLQNRMLEATSSASFEVMDEMIRDVRERAVEYVIVPAGEDIFVVFDRRFDIPNGKPIGK